MYNNSLFLFILTKRRISLLSNFSKVNPLIKAGAAAACCGGCVLSFGFVIVAANWLCSASSRLTSFSDS